MKQAAAKIVQILVNYSRTDIAQEILTRFNDDSDLLKKVVTNHGWMAMTLKPKPNHLNGSVQRNQARSSSVKCEGFAHCFLRLQWSGAPWILATRLYVRYWNTNLKLCADYAKQFVRNAQNCGNHVNQSWIFHHDNAPAHTSMLVREIIGQKQNRNHVFTTVFTRLGTRWLLPLLKTENINERKAFCYDWGDKRKIKTGAVSDTK